MAHWSAFKLKFLKKNFLIPSTTYICAVPSTTYNFVLQKKMAYRQAKKRAFETSTFKKLYEKSFKNFFGKKVYKDSNNNLYVVIHLPSGHINIIQLNGEGLLTTSV